MSDVNNPNFESFARQVAGRCFLNGTEISFVSFEVESNSFNSADTFSVVLALSDLPSSMQMTSWWADQTIIKVELRIVIITDSGKAEESLITGNTDNYHFDPAKFEVTCEGRDFTAYFIDAKSAGESFKNYTSSQIATMLAKRHSLTPVVTKTSKRFGEFYQIDSVHLSGEQSEWDILCTLAAMEDYRVYVSGENLYFQPKGDDSRADNYVIRYVKPGTLAYPQANVSDDLQFSRAMTITKGVTVEVLSWHSRFKKQVQFVASYPKTTKSTTPGNSTSKTPQVYRLIRNGLTPAQAYALAQKVYQDIVKHEMKVSGSLAGDNLLTPQTLLRIEGTQSAFDQLYWCDAVRRSFSLDSGYTMSFTAKNNSPALEVSTS